MRIDVKKFLFLGTKKDQDLFFIEAQNAGVIHFIDAEKKLKELPSNTEHLHHAIKILRSLSVTEQEEDLHDSILSEELAKEIIHAKDSIEKLQEQRRFISLEKERVAIFGNFKKIDIAFIEKTGHRVIQFFFGKHGIEKEISLPDEVIYVGSDHGLDYFVSINKTAQLYPKLVEMKIEHPIEELKIKEKIIDEELTSLEHKLKTYAKYNTSLHHALINKINKHALKTVHDSANPVLEDSLFVTTGWIPENKISNISKMIEKNHIYMEELLTDSDETPPTYLENSGFSRIGEDLINIYDTPSSNDKDPSLWVLFSFALFFAFIIGDAGYGTLFLGIALYLRYKYSKLHGVKERFLNLFTLLCFSTIAWGLLTTSFFGINFPPDSFFRTHSPIHWIQTKKVSYHMAHQDETYQYWIKKYPQLNHVSDPQEFLIKAGPIQSDGTVSHDVMSKLSDHLLFELALLIGIIHIILSLLRYLKRSPKNLGWIFFILGAYLYLPYYLQTTSLFNVFTNLTPKEVAHVGLYMMGGGISFALLCAIISDKLFGIFELMTAIGIFGDVMSYLRLYALGLAGAIVTTTINDAASSIGLVLGTLLILIGHTLNMALAVMGGVIHGLRLNFIEWYHYSFEGGGKKFKPLEKIKID